MDEQIQTTPPTPETSGTTSSSTSNVDIKALNEKIQKESAFVDLLTMEMSKVIIGQSHIIFFCS